MTNQQIATTYAQDAVSGKLPACIYVKQACERFLKDVAGPEHYYDSDSVDKVIRFLNALNLTEQKKIKKFILEPWQTFIIANLYGIHRTDTDERKYQSAYIELARKNGKSQLATGLSMYHLLTDPDAQVVLSANSKNQVKDVDFKKVKQFSHQLDPKEKHLVPYYNSIKFGVSNELIVTASDASKLDGLNVSFCLIDELHEAPNGLMYGVMKSSMGSRDEPLLVVITTAGFDTESFCYQQRTYCTEILSGNKVDDTQFAIIYTIDADDDFTNEENWIKANPNLNVSVKVNYLKGEVNKATQNVSEKASVMVKHFNRWLKANTLDVWIDESYVNASMVDIKMSDPMFADQDCIVGVDLASVSDITAVTYLFRVNGYIYFFNEYYIPEDSVNSNANILSFKEAGANKELNITSGNVCDYDIILKDIIKVSEQFNLKALYYDKFNSTQFIINATEAGLKCEPFSQMPGSLNKPLKEFERLIKSDGIRIQRNTITRWMLGNVVLVVNKMGNYSIDKSSKNKKIDGVASMIDAMGGLLQSPIYNFDVQ